MVLLMLNHHESRCYSEVFSRQITYTYLSERDIYFLISVNSEICIDCMQTNCFNKWNKKSLCLD